LKPNPPAYAGTYKEAYGPEHRTVFGLPCETRTLRDEHVFDGPG